MTLTLSHAIAALIVTVVLVSYFVVDERRSGHHITAEKVAMMLGVSAPWAIGLVVVLGWCWQMIAFGWWVTLG